MHRTRLFVYFALLAALIVLHPQAAKADLELRSAHPYLTYSDANIARLKERIRTEPSIASAWERMLARATEMIEQPAETGRRASRGLDLLSLAYRMTGDARFGERVKEMMTRHRFGGRADRIGLLRDPQWHSTLDAGDNNESFGIAYDSIYDLLSAKERKQFAARLIEEGIEPVLDDWVLGERRIHSLDTMGHNWWSEIVFGTGVGAIAIFNEDPRAPGWVERIGVADAEWLSYAGSRLKNKPANFDRNGGFYESVSYAAYAIRSHLPFRMAWRDAFTTPLPDHPVLSKISDFFLHTSYPRSAGRPWSFNFGDSGRGSGGSRALTMLWDLGYRSPDVLWYIDKFRGGRRANFPPPDDPGLMRSSPRDLLYAPTDDEIAAIPETPDLPLSFILPDMGWVAMRSSWDNDATVLGIKSGYTWNHAHADAGSFMLFHRGKSLLIDSGKSGYSTPQYDDYYRQSVAHNVVTFNGRAENPEDTYFGSKHHGTVSNLIDTGDLRYVLADATGPTSDTFIRNFRSFLWVGDIILVIDDLKSFEPGQFEWLLHYDGEAERRGQDFTVTQDDVSVVVRPLFPEPFPDAGLPTDYPESMRLSERMGLMDGEPETPVPYAVFEPTELSRRVKFITAIMPVPEGEWQPPTFERLQTLHMNGLRITQDGTVTELWLNLMADGRVRHRPPHLEYDGWETDAYITVMTWPEGADLHDPDKASQMLVVDGSYLRRDDKMVLDSLSKLTLSVTRDGSDLDVQLQGQPVINAFVRSTRKPGQVVLNGDSVKAAYDKTRRTIQLSVRPE